MKRNLLIAITTAILTAIDQVIKIIAYENLQESGIVLINGVLNLTYVENTGAAFGSFSRSTLILTVVSIAIIAALLYFVFTKKYELNKANLVRINFSNIRRGPEI